MYNEVHAFGFGKRARVRLPLQQKNNDLHNKENSERKTKVSKTTKIEVDKKKRMDDFIKPVVG